MADETPNPDFKTPPPMSSIFKREESSTADNDDGLISLQPSVNFDEVSLQEKVGHGSYGIVYKAIWNGKDVAVKEFGPTAEQKAIQTEVKQLSRVCHPNIIALFGISYNKQSKYLIMEYAEGGSLHNFLHGAGKPSYTIAHAMNWALQCAEGVAYLHAMKPKPLIHRDLKPLNLLLTNRGRHLKICDFGTVADKSTWMTNNKGSAAWMAPEVFEGSKYTEKCDIFSWAIVLWEVLSRQQPFKDIDNTYSIMWKIHKGERPPLIMDCPERIKELMTSCWATVPEVRPTMNHVVAVMTELSSLFAGADEPLEYEFMNQQIIRTGSSDSIDRNNLVYESSYSDNNSTTSTQITPTNPSSNNSSATPTEMSTENFLKVHSTAAAPTAAITASTRWDVIPEDLEASQKNDGNNANNVTTSLSPGVRNETIRNCLPALPKIGRAMPPLTVKVDPNAWNLIEPGFIQSAKTDDKDCLTVTDAKPNMCRTCVDQPSASASTSTTNEITNRELSGNNDDDDDDADDDDNDITDQSLTEMLDPELRPEEPLPDSIESQNIYSEHRRLAKEYLRVDTDLYYAQNTKKKLLLDIQDPNERAQKEEILKKMKEKAELLELFNNLKHQLDKVRGSTVTNGAAVPPEMPADDDWVVIENRVN